MTRAHAVALAALVAACAGMASANPRTHYVLHCMGCHLADGAGAPPAVPALKDRVGYYLEVPGGREYLVQVPGAAQSPLSDAALARVLNWILAELAGASVPASVLPYTAEEVAQLRHRGPADLKRTRDALLVEIDRRHPAR